MLKYGHAATFEYGVYHQAFMLYKEYRSTELYSLNFYDIKKKNYLAYYYSQ